MLKSYETCKAHSCCQVSTYKSVLQDPWTLYASILQAWEPCKFCNLVNPQALQETKHTNYLCDLTLQAARVAKHLRNTSGPASCKTCISAIFAEWSGGGVNLPCQKYPICFYRIEKVFLNPYKNYKFCAFSGYFTKIYSTL